MPARLKNLDAFEVSLVPKAANNRKFLLFKSQGGGKMGDQNKTKKQEEVKKQEDIKKEEHMNPEDMEQQKQETPPEPPSISVGAQNAIIGALKLLQEYQEELPAEALNPLAEIIDQTGRLENVPNIDNPDMVMREEDMDPMEMVAKMKDIPENFKSVIQKIAEENKTMKEEIQKKKDEQAKKEFIEKAKTYSNLSIKAEDFGPVLKEVSEKAPEAYKKLEQVLKAADSGLKNAGLFAEIGSEAQDDNTGDAWSRIEKSAQKYIDEGLSKPDAIAKILKEKPELYHEYQNERRGN